MTYKEVVAVAHMADYFDSACESAWGARVLEVPAVSRPMERMPSCIVEGPYYNMQDFGKGALRERIQIGYEPDNVTDATCAGYTPSWLKPFANV